MQHISYRDRKAFLKRERAFKKNISKKKKKEKQNIQGLVWDNSGLELTCSSRPSIPTRGIGEINFHFVNTLI